ncbi:unnamed protein product [Mytilus coruscus]|uniref:Phorbol-ester/DAG-type domain-containing protein n=1 Tax=Mytilus coruscus TaxID=42192 RepID=A0A6J8AZX3_MYTCO|nr:unnamed protein product [Mytilus coruscus]
MSNTTIQGAKSAVELLNQNLASKLETALDSIENSNSSLEPISSVSNFHKAVEKCHKSKSPSRCITLPTSSEIVRNKNLLSIGTSTLAKTLLLEEIQCNGCNVNLDKIKNRCVNCDMTFHSHCLDQTTDQCFSCIWLEEQDTIINSENFHQTEVKQTSDDFHSLDINNCAPAQNTSISLACSSKNTINSDIQSNPSIQK